MSVTVNSQFDAQGQPRLSSNSQQGVADLNQENQLGHRGEQGFS